MGDAGGLGAEARIESRGGLGATAEAAVAAATSMGYTVVALGPQRFRAARTFRPTWATTTAIVTAVLCGLGLLFLLVKRTETCEIVVTEERTGVVVRLLGGPTQALVTRVGAAVGALGGAPGSSTGASSFAAAPQLATNVPPAPVTPVAPTSFAPVAPVPPHTPTAPSFEPQAWPQQSAVVAPPSEIEERTVLKSQLGGAPSLRLPDGRKIPIGAAIVIGRNPTAPPAAPQATPLAIPDNSLSKTHCVVRTVGTVVEVIDLHSTNKTVVHSASGDVECVPDAPVAVERGAFINVGDVRLEVTS
jgi:hypothetical protein